MTNNPELNDQPAAGGNPLGHAANCLLAYLKVHGKSGQAFAVLQFLAQETLRCLDEGKDPRFNNHAIRSAVTGEKEGDPSAWLSRHWKAINGEIRQQRLEGLQEFAAQQQLDVYPWVSKTESGGGAGNQALYSLVALPLPAPLRPERAASESRPYDIAYIPAENLQPSWWARWLFDGNRVAHGWRKGMLIWPTLIWFVIVALLTVVLFYALSQSKTPLSTHELMATILMGLLVWYAIRVVKRFERLVDDRLIMASEHLVGFREFGVCLELFKPEGSTTDTPKSLRIIKYASRCPTCDAQVLLDEGAPDFPRRIVGRCQESPREHVFSFDRATRTGCRLR